MPTRAFVAAALLAAATPAPAQPPADSTRAKLDRVFSQWSSRDGPGCSVAASQRGKTIYEAGYGQAMLEANVPITPAARLRPT